MLALASSTVLSQAHGAEPLFEPRALKPQPVITTQPTAPTTASEHPPDTAPATTSSPIQPLEPTESSETAAANWPPFLATVQAGSPAQALQQLQAAAPRFATLADYQYWLGVYLDATGAPPQNAAAQYELALLMDPAHAGAWFDYGLILCRMGQQASCVGLLAEAQRRFGTPPIARAKPLPPSLLKGEWRLELGHSSNYNRGSSAQLIPVLIDGERFNLELDPAYRARSAAYARAALSLSYLLPQQPTLELRAELAQRLPFVSQTSRLADNTLELSWQASATQRYALSVQQLRDSQFGSLNIYGLRWRHLAAAGAQPGSYLLIDAALERRSPSQPQSSYASGMAQLGYLWRPQRNLVATAIAGLERDLPSPLRAGGGQRRARVSLSISATNLLPHSGTLGLLLRHTHSRDTDPYSPLFGNTRRSNQALELAATARWPINPKADLLAELSRYNQRSNIGLFIQTENQLSLSWIQRF